MTGAEQRFVAFARVAVPAPLRHLLTYGVPELLRTKLSPGSAVLVPLGSRRVTGYVVDLSDTLEENVKGVKAILAVVGDSPFFPPELLRFILAVSDYYLHPLGETLRTALPSGLEAGKVSGVLASTRLAPRHELVARPSAMLPGDPAELLKRSPRRSDIFDRISIAGSITLSDLRRIHRSPRAFLLKLAEEGWITLEEREAPSDPFFETPVAPDVPPCLTPEQATSVERITDALDQGGYRAFLLHGVTGSGKTEVYLRVISEARKKKLGAAVLVPEIGLTPQLVARFRARFGDDLAVLHSGLGKKERVDQWLALRNGKVTLVVGARSALFAPVERLGVIIVDEEHDPSFKQDQGLKYNARDMALLRAKMSQAVVVLGSATPSLESWRNSSLKKLEKLSMPHRATPHPLPEVEVIDLRQHRTGPFGQDLVSDPLHQAILETLERGEQTILFLNRRGFSPVAICRACGAIQKCRHCSVSMTYHQKAGILRCHYCGGETALPEVCPECRSTGIDLLGSGTERAEGILRTLFPQARVARLDSDVASGRATETVLERLRRHEIDILVGTQMVTKGHDFPKVTLVGVLLADVGLGLPDFRAAERAFHLLTQVAGRAGRGERKGKVLIQTFQPDHPAVVCAKEHDPERFVEMEIDTRRELNYPPFGRLALILVSGPKLDRVTGEAERIGTSLRSLSRKRPEVRVLGPAPAPLAFLRGRHRWRIMIVASRYGDLRALLQPIIGHRPRSGVRMSVDIDPMDLM